MSVTVVIVNWNGRRHLAECLEGLRNQNYRPFSITLVDNGSSDDSVEFVKAHYPEVMVVALPENRGFSAANNIVIQTLETGYVALLNNDAVPHSLWLNRLVEALERHPEAGFAASRMLRYDRPEILDRAGDSYTRAGTALLRGRAETAGSYENEAWVFGACAGAALYRTDLFRDIGCFDEAFFLLYEDVDLSFRAQLKGYKCLYVPGAVVYHKGGSSIGHDSPVSVFYSHRNLEWVFLKNMPARLMLRVLPFHLVYDLAAFFYFLTRGRGRVFLSAKRQALRGLKGILEKRRHIQKARKATDAYIWRIMEREHFIPRLLWRMRRGNGRATDITAVKSRPGG